MRHIFFFFLFSLSLAACAQTRMADVYKKHRFACDDGSTTLELNVCSAEKADFADSLMNRLYQKMIRFFDNKILAETRRLANRGLDSMDRSFAEKERGYYRATKQALSNAQRQWKLLRDAECDLVRVGCEGGTACNAIVNNYYIEMTLARMTALEDFDLLN